MLNLSNNSEAVMPNAMQRILVTNTMEDVVKLSNGTVIAVAAITMPIMEWKATE